MNERAISITEVELQSPSPQQVKGFGATQVLSTISILVNGSSCTTCGATLAIPPDLDPRVGSACPYNLFLTASLGAPFSLTTPDLVVLCP